MTFKLRTPPPNPFHICSEHLSLFNFTNYIYEESLSPSTSSSIGLSSEMHHAGSYSTSSPSGLVRGYLQTIKNKINPPRSRSSHRPREDDGYGYRKGIGMIATGSRSATRLVPFRKCPVALYKDWIGWPERPRRRSHQASRRSQDNNYEFVEGSGEGGMGVEDDGCSFSSGRASYHSDESSFYSQSVSEDEGDSGESQPFRSERYTAGLWYALASPPPAYYSRPQSENTPRARWQLEGIPHVILPAGRTAASRQRRRYLQEHGFELEGSWPSTYSPIPYPPPPGIYELEGDITWNDQPLRDIPNRPLRQYEVIEPEAPLGGPGSSVRGRADAAAAAAAAAE